MVTGFDAPKSRTTRKCPFGNHLRRQAAAAAGIADIQP
jgi:hypothetical protein